VPVTEPLSRDEVERDYEANTGCAIVRRFAAHPPGEAQGVLVAGHGPFCWGKDAAGAAHSAVVLEELARIAYFTLTLNQAAVPLSPFLIDKHFLRKHGPKASYGQKA
jgi:L-ribulose-5-phosphate 4-epimerase